MPTNFPTGVDNFTNPTANDSLNLPSHSTQHANANDAIEAVEAYLLGRLRIKQIVTGTTTTQTLIATSTYTDTTLTATITPSSATSKILVCVYQNGCGKGNSTTLSLQLLRGGSVISLLGNEIGFITLTSYYNYIGTVATMVYDSPNTTSAVTYKTQGKSDLNVSFAGVQLNSAASQIILIEVEV